MSKVAFQGKSFGVGPMQQSRPTFKEKVAVFRNTKKDQGQDQNSFDNNFNETKSSNVARAH